MVDESPLTPSPYEVLGVAPTVNDDELRRAYRRMLRETHPDAGGDAEHFRRVQAAWVQVGTPTARASYDRVGRTAAVPADFAPRPPAARQSTRAQTRSHGHPGGRFREIFLMRLQEWVGLGAPVGDPYEPTRLRSAPRVIRRLLAAAVAEEETARVLASLGIGYTVWHDVDPDPRRDRSVSTPGLVDGPPLSEIAKIDHLVLGPTGLWAMASEDWGVPVAVKRGELTGAGLDPGERPVHRLAAHARSFSRFARVRVSALVIVVADGDAPADLVPLGEVRGMPALLVQRSRLPSVLRGGIEGIGIGGTDLFELRARISAAVRHV